MTAHPPGHALERYRNPYRGGPGRWLRGSFHGHCSEHSGCGSVPLLDGVGRYREVGADFMAVTDHDWITTFDEARREAPGMVFLSGFEYSTDRNLLFIGEQVPPLHRVPLHEAIAQAGALLTIVCHPRPEPDKEYWPLAEIAALPRKPDGIEVYNGHYGIPRMIARGFRPDYSRVWDEVLTAGINLWGFANDDFHEPADFGNAFNMVLAEAATPAAILAAARAGRTYATTGQTGVSVHEEDGCLVVRTAEGCAGRFVGPGGRVLAEQAGRTFRYAPSGEAYVRFEGKGPKGIFFTQPLLHRDAFPAA